MPNESISALRNNLALAALAGDAAALAWAQQRVLRVAMTAMDAPTTTGVPPAGHFP